MAEKAAEIRFHAGDGRPIDFTIYEEDPLDPGQPDLTKPVDLSGATAIRFAIAATVAGTALFTKTKAAGQITVIGANNNVVRVALVKADTLALTPGRLYYELEVTEGGDDWTGPHGVFRLEGSTLK